MRVLLPPSLARSLLNARREVPFNKEESWGLRILPCQGTGLWSREMAARLPTTACTRQRARLRGEQVGFWLALRARCG